MISSSAFSKGSCLRDVTSTKASSRRRFDRTSSNGSATGWEEEEADSELCDGTGWAGDLIARRKAALAAPVKRTCDGNREANSGAWACAWHMSSPDMNSGPDSSGQQSSSDSPESESSLRLPL
eukprot:CAMPEP_0197694834 /NCGR_PEP_ID=MMETSP1338-20131121/114367_1 /TAXON_ID=43686 ORGANISM="Pelagodinium beii, Strain RCC1491" /NCGR_SAMPLE_ID=MMETSP1338 /ASSEMBLY_ACC=CAM_ASM_000754 /LENGTH=122 /DNA_ID=CAMNT_0043277729 /DNA_START=194 /DNA_END=562 /DNA_ORIENTATION=-